MNKSSKLRIPLLVSLAAAAALSVSACGAHLAWVADGSTTTTSGTTAGPALSSSQSGAPTGSAGAVSDTGGQSGLTGGSTGGSPGQFGVGGTTTGAPGVSPAATGMSPDSVATWCKIFNDSLFFTPDHMADTPAFFGAHIERLRTMEDVSPIQYKQNYEILITDYRTLSDGTRLYSQLRDEVNANFKPLKDLNQQICH